MMEKLEMTFSDAVEAVVDQVRKGDAMEGGFAQGPTIAAIKPGDTVMIEGAEVTNTGDTTIFVSGLKRK